MVFSSYLFLFWFLPLTLGVYYTAPRRWRHLLLTLLSYLFYGWANPWFVLLMLFSTAVDYVGGLILIGRLGHSPPSARQRRFGVTLSVVMNLSLLGFFKYLGFAQSSLNVLLEAFGHEAVSVYTVVLPVGISFYTFQSMSYTIDLYREQVPPARSFLDFACYVSLFPQLVAGPIVRYADVAEQLVHRDHTVEKFASGVFFLACGLAKKVLLANPAGEIADACFDAGGLLWHQAWAGALAYAFQIYFDFSGYSDMAVGLGRMLGFEFLRNFNRPYLSESMTEFWHRWHISLSTWLRDYLYIPLGGNRLGPRRTYLNLFATMLLGGLWHGAGWTFVVWGAAHGLLLAFERLAGKDSLYRRAPRPVRVALTFLLVLITFVVFRAETIGAAGRVLRAGVGCGAGSPLLNGLIYSPDHLLYLGVSSVVVWLCPDTWELAEPLTPAKAAGAFALVVLAAAAMLTQSYNPFLYFRF
ncbi:MAG: MBOAT family protein [Armatimonadetes bacterium]|nr:MBOAT family protein [Armatimonadota bacterium]